MLLLLFVQGAETSAHCSGPITIRATGEAALLRDCLGEFSITEKKQYGHPVYTSWYYGYDLFRGADGKWVVKYGRNVPALRCASAGEMCPALCQRWQFWYGRGKYKDGNITAICNKHSK